MCISQAAVQQARAHFNVALGIVAVRRPEHREIMSEAMGRPSPTTNRRVLELSHGQPWRESVLEAVAEVGLAASAEILGGGNG